LHLTLSTQNKTENNVCWYGNSLSTFLLIPEEKFTFSGEKLRKILHFQQTPPFLKKKSSISTKINEERIVSIIFFLLLKVSGNLEMERWKILKFDKLDGGFGNIAIENLKLKFKKQQNPYQINIL
jgi:hypothetical protein